MKNEYTPDCHNKEKMDRRLLCMENALICSSFLVLRSVST
jgi:hypothetical protein